jgi:hypothetical protein
MRLCSHFACRHLGFPVYAPMFSLLFHSHQAVPNFPYSFFHFLSDNQTELLLLSIQLHSLSSVWCFPISHHSPRPLRLPVRCYNCDSAPPTKPSVIRLWFLDPLSCPRVTSHSARRLWASKGQSRLSLRPCQVLKGGITLISMGNAERLGNGYLQVPSWLAHFDDW